MCVRDKISIFGQNFSFRPKLRFSTKVKKIIFLSKFWSKIEILGESRIFVKNINSGRRSKFSEKSKCWSKIECLVEDRNFVNLNISQKRRFSRKSNFCGMF